jgi:hypothetical protein
MGQRSSWSTFFSFADVEASLVDGTLASEDSALRFIMREEGYITGLRAEMIFFVVANLSHLGSGRRM